VHPHGQIGALGIGRADVRHVGLAFDPLFLRANAFGRAVAAFRRFRRGPVNLDSVSSPVAIRITFTALPMTSAGRRWRRALAAG